MLPRTARTWTLALVVSIAASPAFAESLGLPDDLRGDPEAQGFADLLFAHGMVQLAEDDCGAALPLFEKAAATRPEDATYRYFTGICLHRLGRSTEAIAALNAALPPAGSRIPESRIRSDLGDVHRAAGDFAAAERELRQAVALDGDDGRTHFLLGLTLLASGGQDDGLAEIERAVALDPTLAAEAEYYRGIAAERAGDTAAAQGHFAAAAASGDRRVAASSVEWLESLEGAKAGPLPPRGEIRVGLSVESDDNPGQINEDVFLVGDDDDDSRTVLQLRAAYHPLTSASGANVGLVLHAYASRHGDFEAADLDGVQGIVQAAWGADPLGFYNAPLGYVRVPVGQRRLGFVLAGGSSWFALDGESFRRDHELAASLIIGEPGFGKTQIETRYDDLDYLDDSLYEGYNGHGVQLRVGQYFQLGARPDRYLRAALGRTDRSARQRALETTSDQALVELALPIGLRCTLFLYGAVTDDEYDDASQAFYAITESREDRRTDLVASGAIAITRHLYATLRYRLVDREVDPTPLDYLSYDRRIVSAGLNLHW